MKTDHYRLTKNEKQGIALNLVNIVEKNETITKETYRFIANWVISDGSEKTKAFYDVWEIVLKNYLPISRPVLFRSCNRISKSNKIVSFTDRLECARRFSNGKGTLIICDTNESLKLENKIFDPGKYKNTFYPLHEAIKKW
ncbi:hypothetical protein [Nonlabens sp.]|uniref:hypothetical protein n=1 Tax=Nonlabens sp. TaxID=1888209 RepID=UPI003262E40F